MSSKVSRILLSTDTGVEQVSRNKAKTQENKLDRSINYREAIVDPGTLSFDPPAIEETNFLDGLKSYRKAVKNVIKRN